jgi:predicted Holliday junction resolvase-like endonuclease
MNEEDCRLRLQRLYKLTAKEATELIRNAENNRKLLRLKQVREQSKKLNENLSKNVRITERNVLKEMSNTLYKVTLKKMSKDFSESF